jgi:hypothetical protein
MDLKQYFKLGIVLPIIIGLMAGSILFMLGELDDAPGLCLIGIILCVWLMFIGIKNINKINKNIKPIIVLPIFGGIIGIMPIINYLIKGVYNEPPGVIMGGLLVCTALIIFGIVNIFKIKRIKNKGRPENKGA